MIHPNSVLAYWQGSIELFGKRHQKVIAALGSARAPLSDREVMVACRFTDPNAVRPRITELIEVGIVAEDGSRVCPVTGKTVRLVKLAPREMQAELPLDAGQLQTVAEEISKHRRIA